MRRTERERRELMNDDGKPYLRPVAALARRISVIQWFHAAKDHRDPQLRLAQAIGEHLTRCSLEPKPETAVIVDREEGARVLRDAVLDIGRPRWSEAMLGKLEEARAAILGAGRAASHPLLFLSGNALLMRPEVLPVPADRLRASLAGALGGGSEPLADQLVERTLFEIGAMFAWEIVADVLGPNPFVPLLAIYEEGLYPVELTGETAVLWAPSLGRESGTVPSGE